MTTSPADIPCVPPKELCSFLGINHMTLHRFREYTDRGPVPGTRFSARDVHHLYLFLIITRGTDFNPGHGAARVEPVRWVWEPTMRAIDDGHGEGWIVVHRDDASPRWFDEVEGASIYTMLNSSKFRMSAIVELNLPTDVQEWVLAWLGTTSRRT